MIDLFILLSVKLLDFPALDFSDIFFRDSTRIER